MLEVGGAGPLSFEIPTFRSGFPASSTPGCLTGSTGFWLSGLALGMKGLETCCVTGSTRFCSAGSGGLELGCLIGWTDFCSTGLSPGCWTDETGFVLGCWADTAACTGLAESETGLGGSCLAVVTVGGGWGLDLRPSSGEELEIATAAGGG